MLRIFARHDSFDALACAVHSALECFGPPVLEPALAACAAATSEDERSSLAGLLVDLGVRDDRILALLVGVLERDPLDGACLLKEYGDLAALPHLHAALDGWRRVSGGGRRADNCIRAIVDAIDELEEFEQRFLQELRARRLRLTRGPRPQPPRPRAPGRNAPCPCGSGRKFKKCCLG